MRTKIVYKILSLSLFASAITNAAPAPNLIAQAFPKSKLTSYFNKCPRDNGKIDWSMVAQLEKMDQTAFNVEQYVAKQVIPCINVKDNPKYIDEIKATCNTSKGSTNQITVCKAVGINLTNSDSGITALPARSAGLPDSDVVKLLDKAVPKSFIKCSVGSAKINWPLVKQVEDNAANKNSANGQIANYFKDRVDGCMDNKKNPNFLTALESTCSQGVGSPQQIKICTAVATATGRKNPVSQGTDSHSLESSLQDLSKQATAQLDSLTTEKTALQTAHDDLTSQVTAAKAQSDSDAQKIADLEAQLKDAQDKLAAIPPVDDQKVSDLEAQLKDAQDKLAASSAQNEAELANYKDQVKSTMEQWQQAVLKAVDDWKTQQTAEQADSASYLKTVDDGNSGITANG